MTASETTMKAIRMPMLVNSAASPIGTKPAINAATIPTIQVGRWGTWLRLVTANQPGSPEHEGEKHGQDADDGADGHHVGEPVEPDGFERRREAAFLVDLVIVLNTGEHGAGQQVEHHGDRQRVDDRLRQVALGVFGLLRGRAHRVVPKDGEEHLPKAIIYSLTISMVLYLLACTVLTGIQHYDQIDKKSGFATAFKSVGLDRFADVVAVGAIVGILTVLFSFMLGASRIWYAISRDGLLPGWFAVTNRNHVPHRPTWIVGIVAALIAGFVPIGDAAELTNIGILIAFIVVSLAVIVLRYRSP